MTTDIIERLQGENYVDAIDDAVAEIGRLRAERDAAHAAGAAEERARNIEVVKARLAAVANKIRTHRERSIIESTANYLTGAQDYLELVLDELSKAAGQ